MTRRFLWCVLAHCALLAVSLPALADQAVKDAGKLSGIWWSTGGVHALKPTGEAAPPLTARGRELYAVSAKHIAPTLKGPRSRNDIGVCAPFGVPRIWTQPFPFQILEKPDFVAIVYEHNRVFRIIYLNSNPPDPNEDDPAFQGHSVGHWEGDTLVIDSAVFNDRTVLDDTGLPHSDQLKVTERIRKSGDGKTLEVVVTLEDPVVFTKPWSSRLTFAARPDAQIEEYICGQGEFETRYTRSKAAK